MLAGKRVTGKRKKASAVVDPIETLKSLESVHETLASTQKLRNYFQVERDKVNALWEATKKELENGRLALLNAESTLEQKERDHQVEMKVYKQKVRHLLYEQKLKTKQLKEESDRVLQEAEQSFQKELQNIQNDKRACMKGMEKKKETYENHVAEERDSHQYMLTVTKQQSHEREVARLKAANESKLEVLREELELRRRAEIHEAEERRNEHINNLIRQHEEKFKEMKAYYNQITANNLEIIRSLKDEIQVMKQNDEHNEKLMYDIERQNHNLIVPVERVQQEVETLKQRKKLYDQDKTRLQQTRARLSALRLDMKKLREKHAELEDEYRKTYNERDDIQAKFASTLQQAMEVVEERNTSLQHNLLEANSRVEEREEQLLAVMGAMNLEPAAAEMLSGAVEQSLDVKTQMIKELHFELKKLEKNQQLLIAEYERKCTQSNLQPLDRGQFV